MTKVPEIDERPNTSDDDAVVDAARRLQKLRRPKTWADEMAIVLERSPRLRRVIRVVTQKYDEDADDVGQVVKIALIDAIKRRKVPKPEGMFAVAWQIAKRACLRELEKRNATVSLDELIDNVGGLDEIGESESDIDAIQDKLHRNSLLGAMRKYYEASMQKKQLDQNQSPPVAALPAPLAGLSMKPRERISRAKVNRESNISKIRRTPEQQRLYELWKATGYAQVKYVEEINKFYANNAVVEVNGHKEKYTLSADAFKAYIAARTKSVHPIALQYAENFHRMCGEKNIAEMKAFVEKHGGIPGVVRAWAKRLGIMDEAQIDRGVAAVIGVNHTTVNRWRRGFQKPRISEVMVYELRVRNWIREPTQSTTHAQHKPSKRDATPFNSEVGLNLPVGVNLEEFGPEPIMQRVPGRPRKTAE